MVINFYKLQTFISSHLSRLYKNLLSHGYICILHQKIREVNYLFPMLTPKLSYYLTSLILLYLI